MSKRTRRDNSIQILDRFAHRLAKLQQPISFLRRDNTRLPNRFLTGNRNNTGQTIGSDNRLTQDANWTYAYDNEGNLISKTSLDSSQSWQYTYDAKNELLTVTHNQNFLFSPTQGWIHPGDPVPGDADRLSCCRGITPINASF